MPRFSANLGLLWPDLPLLARMEAAAKAGFRAVEMHFPYDVPPAEVADAARRNDLVLLGINTRPGDPSRGERGLGALPGRERDFQAAVDESIAYCVASSARAIHVMAGNVAEEDRQRARAVFAENLRVAAAKAAAHNLRLLLEPLNPRDNPGYFYSTLAAAVSLIEELALPNIELQFDVYHVAVSEGDVLTKLKRYMPLVGNVQIAAVPSRAEPDEGEIAYPAIFAAVDELGYQGWIGCEYRPRGDTNEGLRWTRSLGAAFEAPFEAHYSSLELLNMTRKVAVVTGAGSGIGKGVALALADAGYAVALAGRRLQALEETARNAGSEALPVVTDVTDPASVAALFSRTVERFGRVDVLFNNAGTNTPPSPLDEVGFEQWRRVIDTNLTGVFLCTQAAFRQMKTQSPRGGRIINNGSISATTPRPHMAAYTASKHAVSGLTKTTSLEGRQYDIACGQIDIGNAATELAASFSKGTLQADLSLKPEPTFDVKYVAEAVLYMAGLPLEANVLFMTVMATKMPYSGRG